MSLVLGLLVAVVVLYVALAAYSRRGEHREDTQHRSAAVFCADSPEATVTKSLHSMSQRNGLGLLERIAVALNVSVSNDEAFGFDAPYWELTFPFESDSYTLGLTDVDDDTWLVRVIVLSGAPAPLPVVQHVHQALERVSEIRDLRWVHRHRAFEGDFSDGAAHPGA